MIRFSSLEWRQHIHSVFFLRFRETSTNIIIWILPLVNGKLENHESQWAGKLKDVRKLFISSSDCGNVVLLAAGSSPVGRIILPVSILNDNVDSCEYGPYALTHDHLIWLLGLYYDFPYYSV